MIFSFNWKRAIAARTPALLLAAILFIVAYAAPLEVRDILYDIAAPASYLWNLVFPVLLLVALHNAAYIGRHAHFRVWIDPILLALPMLAVAVLFWRSKGALEWGTLLPPLAIAVAAAVFDILIRRRIRVVQWLTYLLLIILYAALVWLTLGDPVGFSRSVGSLAIVVTALALATVVVGAVIARPRLGALVVIAGALVFFFDPARHVIEFQPAADPQKLSDSFGVGLMSWLEEREDLEPYKAADQAYPVFLVAAEGGGIYAASHAYLLLSRMARVCPNFPQHIFAAAGVSGGSLGLGLFQAEASQKEQLETLEACKAIPGLSGAKSDKGDETELIGDEVPVLSDHLAPALATMLFVESLDAVLPGRWFNLDRGAALGLSIEQSDGGIGQPLAANFLESWRYDSAAPALVPVTTDIRTGNRFAFSPMSTSDYFAFRESSEWYAEPNAGKDLKTSSAISASARFPWLTPTVALEVPREEGQPDRGVVLADGGYFENSGIDTVMEIFSEVELESQRPTSECRLIVRGMNDVTSDFGFGASRQTIWGDGCDKYISVTVLAIGVTPADQDATLTQSFLFDPVATMLAARSARGRLALHRAEREFCGLRPCHDMRYQPSDKIFAFQIPRTDLGLPLSWKMSRERMGRLSAQVAVTDDCSALKGGADGPSAVVTPPRQTSHNPNEPQDEAMQEQLARGRAFSGCMVALIADLFNPAGVSGHHSVPLISIHDASE
jgi:hypothetical protein